MRIEQVKLYKFDELSEESQQVAIDNWRNSNYEVAWQSEWEDSLNKFCDIFPIKWDSWDIYQRINYRIQCDDEIRELSGIRLLKYIINNYWDDIFKGKYYSTDGQWINGKYHYKKRYSKCQFEFDCPLTGFCGDYDILQPILDFLKNPQDNITFEDLLSDCLASWRIAVKNDYESQQSDEYIKECLEINEYEFTEDGEIF